MWVRWAVLTTAIVAICQFNESQSASHYVGGVVEYHRFWDYRLDSKTNLMLNVRNYTEIIEHGAAKGIDIIVFPEVALQAAGTTEFVPVPEPAMNVTPRTDASQHEALRALSSAAHEHGMYVVVNLKEISRSANSTNVYNTNVAFDRNGTVVGRYRKFHPYGENVTKPDTPDHSYFDTDFGVRFGMFTCFDILFEEPAQVLVREYGVTDVAYPTAWYSQLPFLTAVQYQASWSYGTGANMLASGLNHVEGGSTGTGIYAGGDGPLEYILSEKNGCKLIYQKIPIRGKFGDGVDGKNRPIVPSDGDSKPAGVGRCALETGAGKLTVLKENLGQYTTELLNPAYDSEVEVEADLEKRTKTKLYSVETEVCQKNRFCCSYRLLFEMRFVPLGHRPGARATRGDDFREFRYRFAVLDGVRDFSGITTGGLQICGLISCLDESLDSCGLRADSSSRPVSRMTVEDPDFGTLVLDRTLFREISINGTFANNGSFVSPNLLVGSERKDVFGEVPSAEEFLFARSVVPRGIKAWLGLGYEGRGNISLVTASIYSRVYERDGQRPGRVGEDLEAGSRF